MNTFKLEIVTPENAYVSAEVQMVKLHLADGDYVLLAGHEPVTAALEFGLLQYRNAAGELHEVICADGFVEMTADGATVFTDQCLDADGLDEEQEKKKTAELIARQKYEESLVEHHSASIFLVRAMEKRRRFK